MHFKLTLPAVADLCEIEDYINKNNIFAAQNLIHRLELRCKSLTRNPHLGSKRDYLKPGLRTITESKNYLICYRIRKDSIEVLRILHGARDVEKILRKMQSD